MCTRSIAAARVTAADQNAVARTASKGDVPATADRHQRRVVVGRLISERNARRLPRLRLAQQSEPDSRHDVPPVGSGNGTRRSADDHDLVQAWVDSGRNLGDLPAGEYVVHGPIRLSPRGVLFPDTEPVSA